MNSYAVLRCSALAVIILQCLRAGVLAQAASCTTYTVKSGDTCYAISQAHSVSLSQFKSWNQGIDCNNLQIGQKVCVSPPTSAPSPPSSSAPNGKVFREYIGALYNGVSLANVPVNPTVQVHLILSFAIDYAADGSASTNGNFAEFWDTSRITAATISAWKSQHSNGKVMVSLGGDTVNGQPAQFHPTSVSSWLANAVPSLTSLVHRYGLDGIDIDYEHFDLASSSDFSSCIGQLISQLKNQGVITVASIAPFDSVQAPYTALWSQHSGVIDYVNFQFYTYGAATTPSQFVARYNAAATTYSGGKVLASFTTATGADSVTPANALAACQQLHSSNKLPGIFIWCADTSFASSAKFQYEQQAQALLAR